MRGLYTALVTPFDTAGKVNEPMLRHLINLQLEAEVDGIVVLGTTGEAPTLTQSEKQAIIGIAHEMLKGKIPLLAGTGSYSTAQTIENTVEAKKWGADGALIVTPYYNRPSQEGLYKHYQAVAEAVDLPIIVYNIQGRTAQNLQTETLARIATHPNICGVKEVSGSQQQMIDVIELARSKPNFSVFSGDDPTAFSCIMQGGDGVISVASNLVPATMQKLVQTALKGDVEEAHRHQRDLLPLFRALSLDTNPIPIKYAMHVCGIDVGGYRLPLCPMSLQNQEKMRHMLPAMADLLCINQK